MASRSGYGDVLVKEFISHTTPPLKLSEHVGQVREASRAIWRRHSDRLRSQCADVMCWIEDGVTLHDAGKGSEGFQLYISSPGAYSGGKLAKAHTPLSFVFTIYFGKSEGWDWGRRLAVAALAAGHHSEFKARDLLEHIVANSAMEKTLKVQMSLLDWESLNHVLGIKLARPNSIQDFCGEVLDELMDVLFPTLACLVKKSLDEALGFRLRCQLAFSVLLEADKAFLAVKPDHINQYLSDGSADLPATLVDTLLAKKLSTPLDSLRLDARRAMLAGLDLVSEERIHSMTLPTGTGKTLLAATWAFQVRERLKNIDRAPKIVIVLPYLSIIDQTQEEYRRLLASIEGEGVLLPYHSLSERVFDSEAEMDDNTNDFFVDTWHSDVVITTFDQFLFALMSPKARHQIRFHQLCDALIVMDEVQTLPCRLWNPLDKGLQQLTKLGNTHVLAMSATQPRFLTGATEIIKQPETFFSGLDRYCLRLRHQSSHSLDQFIDETLVRLPKWKDRRILLVFNTRNSARRVRDAFDKAGVAPLFFLSADVTPGERLGVIEEIKRGQPAIVVATQCIEAGVDIDLDHVIRDFGPLDCIIQVAGRCNRNARTSRRDVEIVNLMDDRGNSFAKMIYDPVSLQATRRVLGTKETYVEEDVFELSERYFEELRREKDQGESFTRNWASWEAMDPVRELLRGAEIKQESFLVVEQDGQIIKDLAQVFAIPDRWERKRAYRKLAPRVARITVSVYARTDFDPSHYADRLGFLWILRRDYYSLGRGLDLKLGDQESQWGIIL